MFDFEDFQRTGGPVRLGLLLGGRGLEGLAALPTLVFLEREGLIPDVLVASGGAALLAGQWAAGVAPSEMLDRALVLGETDKLGHESKLAEVVLRNLSFNRLFDAGTANTPKAKGNGKVACKRLDALLDNWIGDADFLDGECDVVIEYRCEENQQLRDVTGGAISPAVRSAQSGDAFLPVQPALARGLSKLVGIAPKSLGASVGNGPVDRSCMPHGLLIEVDVPAMAPWTINAIPAVLAAGQEALDKNRQALLEMFGELAAAA